MQRQLLLTDMHKKMTERYICGLEDSHNRISKELHDGVCNDLLSVEMEMKQSDNSAITTQLKQIREICATFRISWQLLPSATLACTRYSHFTRIS